MNMIHFISVLLHTCFTFVSLYCEILSDEKKHSVLVVFILYTTSELLNGLLTFSVCHVHIVKYCWDVENVKDTPNQHEELVAKMADCCVASRRQCLSEKVALEHTAQTTTNGQLARTFCACMRENSCVPIPGLWPSKDAAFAVYVGHVLWRPRRPNQAVSKMRQSGQRQIPCLCQ